MEISNIDWLFLHSARISLAVPQLVVYWSSSTVKRYKFGTVFTQHWYMENSYRWMTSFWYRPTCNQYGSISPIAPLLDHKTLNPLIYVRCLYSICYQVPGLSRKYGPSSKSSELLLRCLSRTSYYEMSIPSTLTCESCFSSGIKLTTSYRTPFTPSCSPDCCHGARSVSPWPCDHILLDTFEAWSSCKRLVF